MRALITSLALIVLLSSTSVSLAGNWFQALVRSPMQKGYDTLNGWVDVHCRLVNCDEPEEVLIAGLNWLKMKLGEMAPSKGVDVQKLPKAEVLLTFTGLIKLLDPERPLCNLEGMKILEDNQDACGVDLMKPEEDMKNPLRPIERVVHDVALSHARMCRHEHPARFAVALKMMDKVILDEIEGLLEAVIETSKMPVFDAEHHEAGYIVSQKATTITWRHDDEIEAILTHLRSTLNTPEAVYLRKLPDLKSGKPIIKEKEIKDVLNDHLFSKCEYVSKVFHPTIAPATFDQRIFPPELKYRVIDNDTNNLILWIAYYDLCKNLNEHHRAFVTNKIIKMIKDEKE